MTAKPADESHFTEASLSQWHAELCAGDPQATTRLWETYFERMVAVARKRLRGARTSVRDEEDVALSAFKSFCLGVQQGRIALDQSQLNLWPLLVTITLNKAIDQIRHDNRHKRSTHTENTEGPLDLQELVSHDANPELVAAASESFERLLEVLDRTQDNDLRELAIASIEGNTPAEIAAVMNCSTRTIQRKLKTIQSLWKAESS